MALVLREDFDAAQLRLCARQSDDADQVRRLLALAAIYDGASRAEAAEIGGVTRQIVRDWVERLNTGGPGALVARKAPGKSPLLTHDQRAALAQAVEDGPTACHRRGGALALGRFSAVGVGPVCCQHLAPDARPRTARHAVSQAVGPPTPPRAGGGRGGRF